jgi:phage shock protein A
MPQSILGRMGQLIRANIGAILDSVEDPEVMLDQLIRDYTDSIAEVERTVAQTVGNLRLLEEDQTEAADAQREWGDKAAAASRKADEVRSQGGTDADRFDELAKIALRRQISYEQQSRSLTNQVTQQRALVDQLKTGLYKLRAKREELVSKRDELVSRAKMAHAQIQVQEAVKSVSVMDPTSELGRFEERIRRQEAMARGMEEVAATSLDEQFAQLEKSEDELEVEARLAALKAGEDPLRIESGEAPTAAATASAGASAGSTPGS